MFFFFTPRYRSHTSQHAVHCGFVFLTESYKFNRSFQKYRLLIKGLDLLFVHFFLLVFECYFLLILDEG